MKFYGQHYVEEKKNGGARRLLGIIVEQIKNVHISEYSNSETASIDEMHFINEDWIASWWDKLEKCASCR